MGILSSLIRSSQKNKAMRKAISVEISTYDTENLTNSRKMLYNYLIKDEILSQVFSSYTFQAFNDAVSILRALGFTYSKNGDYIPIATFCFLRPLSASVSFFLKHEMSKDDFWVSIYDYFNN